MTRQELVNKMCIAGLGTVRESTADKLLQVVLDSKDEIFEIDVDKNFPIIAIRKDFQ